VCIQGPDFEDVERMSADSSEDDDDDNDDEDDDEDEEMSKPKQQQRSEIGFSFQEVF